MKSFVYQWRTSVYLLYELSLAASLIKVKIIIRPTLKKRANRLAKDDKWLVILHKWSNEIEMWNQHWNLELRKFGLSEEDTVPMEQADVNICSRCTCFTRLTDCSACVTFSENVLSSSDSVLICAFPGWKNDDSQVNNSPSHKNWQVILLTMMFVLLKQFLLLNFNFWEQVCR